MKQFRFGLCPNLDANLLARIEQRANGGSKNDAARFLLRFWHEQEQCQDMTPERQNSAIERTDLDKDNDSQEINLNGLDSVFSELGE